MSRRRLIFYLVFFVVAFGMILAEDRIDDRLWAYAFLAWPFVARMITGIVHLWDGPGTNIFGEPFNKPDGTDSDVSRISWGQALSILGAVLLIPAVVSSVQYMRGHYHLLGSTEIATLKQVDAAVAVGVVVLFLVLLLRGLNA